MLYSTFVRSWSFSQLIKSAWTDNSLGPMLCYLFALVWYQIMGNLKINYEIRSPDLEPVVSLSELSHICIVPFLCVHFSWVSRLFSYAFGLWIVGRMWHSNFLNWASRCFHMLCWILFSSYAPLDFAFSSHLWLPSTSPSLSFWVILSRHSISL